MSERGKHPNLLFDENDLARVRRNIENYDWARTLYEEVKAVVDGGPDPWQFDPDWPRFTMTFPPDEKYLAGPVEPGCQRDARVHGRSIMEFALVAAVSGEEKYSRRLVELLPRVAELLASPCDLAAYPQIVNWTTGHDASEVLVAYDLTYHDQTWTPEARRKVEEGLKIIAEQIMAEPSAKHLCNTGFCFQIYKVLAGCFFNNKEWIEAGVEGPGGFKDLLSPPTREGGKLDMRWYVTEGGIDSPHHQVQRLGRGTVDGGIWYETGGYGLGAVLSDLVSIAEAMLHYDGTNLYEYEAPGGGAIRNYFRCAIDRSFSDGQPTFFGAAGGPPPLRSLPPVEDIAGAEHTTLRIPLPGHKWDIAYLRYRAPAFAWAALQVPGRRARGDAWGYGALWHGLDASEMEVRAPAMRSRTFPGFKIAVLRSTEGEEFWNSETPTVAVRWGEGIYRAHPDQFSFKLAARLGPRHRAGHQLPLGLRRAAGRTQPHPLRLFVLRAQYHGRGPPQPQPGGG